MAVKPIEDVCECWSVAFFSHLEDSDADAGAVQHEAVAEESALVPHSHGVVQVAHVQRVQYLLFRRVRK